MNGSKIFIKFFMLPALAILLSGCASSMMMKTEPFDEADRDHALVTFIRPSAFGGAIQFGIWDSDKFIGILSARSYVQYFAEPGEHIFMARAENWSYVKADLQAGKQYYILGRVFPGVWKARVALDPVTENDETSDTQISEWLAELNPTSVIPEKYDAYADPRTPHAREAVELFDSGKADYKTLEASDYR